MNPSSHTTCITINFPNDTHKELKALSTLMGIPMKDFVLQCVLEKLKKTKDIEEAFDEIAYDKGINRISAQDGITLEEMKKRLGIT